MVLTMIMVIFKMLMICRILMTRVTQSGSHLSRKFPFLLFVSFSPPAEDGRQENFSSLPLPVHYFCSSLIVHTCVCHISNAQTNGE